MPKIDYDKEAKILTIKVSDKKSVDSDAQKNVVVDYGKDGVIRNLAVFNKSGRANSPFEKEPALSD